MNYLDTVVSLLNLDRLCKVIYSALSYDDNDDNNKNSFLSFLSIFFLVINLNIHCTLFIYILDIPGYIFSWTLLSIHNRSMHILK